MTHVLDAAQRAKLLTPGVERLLTATRAAGGEARIVGGAVRDVLLGRMVGDIDLATTLSPEEMMKALAQDNIKTVPTGLAHGTITAAVDHIGYEITTLRQDVITDGRHAQIAFTDNWREDAARRDFTFNALYVDAEGKLYDYFGGIADAKAGWVRFIGKAQDRIQEDVLRILRFFRFTAYLGQVAPDAEALLACHENAPLVPRLSSERIAREVIKLLAAENPSPAWRLMGDAGVTRAFLPEALDIGRLDSLLETEKKYGESSSPWVRLAALLPQDPAVAASVATRLKFSRRDSDRLSLLAKLPALLQDADTPAAMRRVVYGYGQELCRAAVFLKVGNISEARATIDTWESPVFPVRGEDIVKLGIPVGRHIGEVLRAIEAWWIAGDFRASREACLAQARDGGKNH